MAAEAEAARNARAKVIATEGEHKASRVLRHAAEVIADSPAALQADNNSTIVFPVPIEIISRFMKCNQPELPPAVGCLVPNLLLTIAIFCSRPFTPTGRSWCLNTQQRWTTTESWKND